MGCSPSTLPQVELNNASTHVKILEDDATKPAGDGLHVRDVSSSTTQEIDSLLNEEYFITSVNEDSMESYPEVKSIAYDIRLGKENQVSTDVECTLKKNLPNRLKHLEPLPNPPLLTRDKLTKKLKTAEEKRKQILEVKRYSHHRPRTFSFDQVYPNTENEMLKNMRSQSGKRMPRNIMNSTNHNTNHKMSFSRSVSCSDIEEELNNSYESLR